MLRCSMWMSSQRSASAWEMRDDLVWLEHPVGLAGVIALARRSAVPDTDWILVEFLRLDDVVPQDLREKLEVPDDLAVGDRLELLGEAALPAPAFDLPRR